MGPKLHWVDYLILVGFLCVSMGIGLYHAFTGGKQRTTSEFIMADRGLSIIPTMLSLLVSFQSAIMILGHTAEMYTKGSQAWVMEIMAYTLAIILAERLFVTWLYPLKLVSVNEYLERRFKSKSVRIFGSVCGIFTGALYLGVATYAPSIALEAATDIPVAVSIPVMAGVGTIYTALGGMKAVIWTDVFQSGVMFIGLLTILIKGCVALGGFGKVLELADKGGRLNWANFDPNPSVRHTFWGFLFGYTLTWSNTYGLVQQGVQRYSALPTLKKAKITVCLNIPFLLLAISIVCMIGLTCFAYYASIECDPLASKQISNPNQLLSLFVVTLFQKTPGFSGLFLATLYSGALSSISSSLSGKAANLWEDILKWKLESRLTEYQATILNKFLVFCFGAASIGVSFLAATMPGPVSQISIAFIGATGGPVMGMFLLGGIFYQANWIGALAGGISALSLNLWITFGASTVKGFHASLPPTSVAGCYEQIGMNITAPIPKIVTVSGISHLYTLSYIWYTFLGCLVTCVIGIIVSMATGGNKEKIEDKLMLPFRKICLFSCGEEEEVEDETETETEKQSIEENQNTKHLSLNTAMDLDTSKETAVTSVVSDGSYNQSKPPIVHIETSI